MLALQSNVCRVADQRETYRNRFAVARQHAAGYQDRLRGLAPSSDNADYFRGYCEAVCDEIAGRSVWAC